MLEALAERGVVTSADVDVLRCDFYPDGINQRADAETLLAIDLVCHNVCDQWRAWLIDALVEFVIDADGELSEENTVWLLRSMSRHNIVDDADRFELLVRVIEAAGNNVSDLVLLALRQVEMAIVKQQGPLAHLRLVDGPVITSEDVCLLRRILVAVDGKQQTAINRDELALLFELGEHTFPHANHASWQDLFAKALASYVLDREGKGVAPRKIALAIANDVTGDGRIECCVNQLRYAGEELAKPYRLERLDSDDPTHWVIRRFNRHQGFDHDDAGLIEYVTMMASPSRERRMGLY